MLVYEEFRNILGSVSLNAFLALLLSLFLSWCINQLIPGRLPRSYFFYLLFFLAIPAYLVVDDLTKRQDIENCRDNNQIKRYITVNASAGWINSGIGVSNGDLIHFVAIGKWANGEYINGQGQRNMPWYGPDGEPVSELSRFNYPSINAPVGALIAKIGPNGRPFTIGSKRVNFLPDTSGNLFFSINDDLATLNDNKGALRIGVCLGSA